MKKIILLSFVTMSALFFNSCGIGKMVKNSKNVTYQATPNPLEVHADSIKINVNGSFPAKYFHKKASLLVTPYIVYDGGERPIKTAVLVGEKSKTDGKPVNFKEGGKFDINDKIAFESGMENAKVELRASVSHKSKKVELPVVVIGEGTITTSRLLKKDDRSILASDKFDKNPTITQKANIYYVVDQWYVRPAELKSDEMENLFKFATKSAKDGSEFAKLDIYGYASPEGELKRNSMLADKRAEEAYKVISAHLRKNKVEAIKNKDFYSAITTNFEDWAGLKELLQKSEVSGKDQAIKIITTIQDPEQREEEFRKLASYDPIYNTYFPKLRRAEINLIVKKKTRTEDQIRALAVSAPDSLASEELLFGASLQADEASKLKAYQSHARLFPEDWRGFNNSGVILLTQGKVNEANAEFEKADRVNANNPIVKNNLGVIASLKGDKNAAENFYKAASGAGEDVKYNLGNIAVSKGNYSEAVSNYGSACSYNAGLAKLLAGNTSGAQQTVDCSADKDSADGLYLKAVIAARSNNKEGVISNLGAAIAKNGALGTKAKKDLEFRAYKDDSAFKALLN
jgi:tetratricopeptide (TPR) repeat protein